MKIKWMCPKCQDVKISDSREHHQLDMCQCESCFMDLEEYMTRIGGNPEIIKEWK